MNTSKSNTASIRRKLPAKYATIVTPFILSCFMTSIVSLISTLRSVGWSDDILTLWTGAWAISWLVAFPVLLVVLPLTRKLSSWIVQSPP